MMMGIAGVLLLYGCDLQSSSDSPSGTNVDTGTPPPSSIVGTAALAGESATYTLTPASSPSSSVVGRKALYTVTGNIRYRGTSFTVTGTYESVTRVISATSASVTLSGQSVSFKIMGTYSTTEGFSGTIERWVNGVKDLVGSVTGQVPAPSSGAVNYLGTFSGSGEAGGTWKGTFTTEEGNETFSGVWSGAVVTTQGDPHTPASSDPLEYRFALLMQTIYSMLASTEYDIETAGSYPNPDESISYIVEENNAIGCNTAAFTVNSDFTDPVRGIVSKTGGTLTLKFKMPEQTLVQLTANGSFRNSPITTLSMDVLLDNAARTISGTITVDGTGVTDLNTVKNYFF